MRRKAANSSQFGQLLYFRTSGLGELLKVKRGHNISSFSVESDSVLGYLSHPILT
jgi:hypothetical protein